MTSTTPTAPPSTAPQNHTDRTQETLMTTATAPAPTATGITAAGTTKTTQVGGGQKVRLHNVIHGEWIKFWSVRSTSITLLAAGLVTVIFGMIFSSVAGSDAEAPGPAAFLTDPVDVALGGVGLAEMVIGVLGVMVVAGEYSTGLISTSFAAVGRRGRVLWAKSAVLVASVFSVMLAAVTGAIVAGQAVYAGAEDTIPVTEVLDVIFGTSVYLVGIALIGMALGFILRSTAAGIGTLVGGVFIGPNLLNLLPDSITDVFMKYLPSEAGSAMMSRVPNPDLLSNTSA